MLARPLAVLALGGSLFAQTGSATPRPLPELLPASTHVLLQFGGLAACTAGAHELPLAALLRDVLGRLPDDARRERLEGPLDGAARGARRALQRLGLDAADLRAVLQRPAAVAVGRPTLEGMGPSVCLAIDLGDAEAALRRCLAAGRTVLRQHGVTPGEPLRLAGTEFESLQLPGGPPLWLGIAGGVFVASNSRGYLHELGAVVAGGAPSLAAALAAGAAAMPAVAPLGSLFVDGQPLVAACAPLLPYEAQALADALGFGAPRSLHAVVAPGADALRVAVGGRASGLAKVLLAAPAPLDFARACSPNTVVFGAGSIDLAGALDAWQALAAVLPAAVRAEAGREAARAMARLVRRAGATPAGAAALVRALAPQVAFALSLERGAVPRPELLLRLSVRDADVVAAALQRLEAAAGGDGVEWRSRQAGGHTIRFCNLRLGGDGPQVAPSYLLRPDGLWLAADPGTLVRALRRTDDGEPGLAAEADFAAATGLAGGASGMLHLRWSRAAELGWRAVETWGYPQLDAQRDQLGFGREVLPDADEVAAAVGAETICYRIDDDGLTLRHHGALALGSMLAALGVLADEMLARAATGR
ncbi:MAG: hypothetical protein KF830_11820 [Planctomycetes bacterium]|nr:hypothetical protein [Planctomycetota bacterium]